MIKELDLLRELNTWSVLLRPFVAALLGGLIGLERERKRRPAGFRTYMLVCMGAALAMMLGQYVDSLGGTRSDMSRFGAQVINGIGFLGAGTILVTGRQEVKGLTTAAGLWASACMGLAIGAGFYEAVLLAALLIFFVVRILSRLEAFMVEKGRNLNIYVVFESLDDLSDIIAAIKSHDASIHEIEIEKAQEATGKRPGALFFLHLEKRQSHAKFMAALSEVECIYLMEEI